MKKFLIILSAIVAIFFAYGIVDMIVLSFSPNYLKRNVDEAEEIDLSNLINSSQEDYYNYYMSYDPIFPESVLIEVDVIEDIVNIEGFDFEPGYEGDLGTIYTGEVGEITWGFNVEQAGFYNVLIDYYPIEGKSSAIERTFLVNGELPFDGASNIVFPRIWGSEGEVIQDIQGNDIRPTQVELPRWNSSFLKDPSGYIAGQYLIYFEQGNNTLTFISEREPLLIGGIKIQSVTERKSYQEVLADYQSKGYEKMDSQIKIIQAENYQYTTSPTLYPQSDKDPATSTSDPKLIKLNTVGGANWNINGDAIVWNFEVEETGLYEISMRVKQSLATGMTSARNIYINGEIPFKELERYTFVQNNSWRIQTLGSSEEPFLFYFEAGKTHELKMETTLGDYGSRIAQVEGTINNLSALYRNIIR